MRHLLVQLTCGLGLVAGGATAARAATVLVTGDHPTRDVIASTLADAGHEVRIADKGGAE